MNDNAGLKRGMIRLCSISAVVFFLITTNLYSQSAGNSPYSGYGIGDINGKGFGNSWGMGGTFIAMQNDSLPVFFINNGNPASYTRNAMAYSQKRLSIIETAFTINHTSLQNSSSLQKVNSGNINCVAMAFPITKWWGSSVGLRPYSSVNYNTSDSKTVNGEVATLSYKGSGGISEVYFGNSITPLSGLTSRFLNSEKYKQLKKDGNDSLISRLLKRKKILAPLSVGANASYYFGNISHTQYSVFPSSGYSFNIRSGTVSRVSDFGVNYGMQYAYSFDTLNGKLKETNTLLFGAVMGAKTNLNTQIDSLSYTYFYNVFDQEVVKDTINSVEGVKGQISVPMFYGFGLGYRRGNNLLILADYYTQQWSHFKAFNQSQQYKDNMKLSLGIQLMPKSQAKTNYFKRVNYRMGLRYEKSLLVLKNYQLTEKAVSFGLGLPVANFWMLNSFSMVNLSVELGQRGTTADGLIKEKFVRAVIGFTLNDHWFDPPKYY